MLVSSHLEESIFDPQVIMYVCPSIVTAFISSSKRCPLSCTKIFAANFRRRNAEDINITVILSRSDQDGLVMVGSRDILQTARNFVHSNTPNPKPNFLVELHILHIASRKLCLMSSDDTPISHFFFYSQFPPFFYHKHVRKMEPAQTYHKPTPTQTMVNARLNIPFFTIIRLSNVFWFIIISTVSKSFRVQYYCSM